MRDVLAAKEAVLSELRAVTERRREALGQVLCFYLAVLNERLTKRGMPEDDREPILQDAVDAAAVALRVAEKNGLIERSAWMKALEPLADQFKTGNKTTSPRAVMFEKEG